MPIFILSTAALLAVERQEMGGGHTGRLATGRESSPRRYVALTWSPASPLSHPGAHFFCFLTSNQKHKCKRVSAKWLYVPPPFKESKASVYAIACR